MSPPVVRPPALRPRRWRCSRRGRRPAGLTPTSHASDGRHTLWPRSPPDRPPGRDVSSPNSRVDQTRSRFNPHPQPPPLGRSTPPHFVRDAGGSADRAGQAAPLGRRGTRRAIRTSTPNTARTGPAKVLAVHGSGSVFGEHRARGRRGALAPCKPGRNGDRSPLRSSVGSGPLPRSLPASGQPHRPRQEAAGPPPASVRAKPSLPAGSGPPSMAPVGHFKRAVHGAHLRVLPPGLARL
jgi:hypothetical protein